MVGFLRKNAAARTSGLDDDDLARMAQAADRRAAALGLSDGPPRLMFAWIVAMTDGAALTAPEIERAPGSSGYLPDVALDLLFDTLAEGDLAQAGAV